MARGAVDDTIGFTSRSGLAAKNSLATQNTAAAAVTWLVSMNTQAPPLDQIEMRRCLSHLFPRRELLKQYLPDHQVAQGYLPETVLGSTQKLLEPPLPIAGCAAKIPPRPLTFAYPSELGNGAAMCALVATSFQSSGYPMVCKGLPFDQLLETISVKRFDLVLFSMTMDLPDVEYFFSGFESAAATNYSNWHSLSFDKLLALARSEPDREKRGSYFLQMNQLLYQEAVTINISYPRHISYRNSCIQGLKIGLLGDAYVDYTKVGLIPGCSIGEREPL